MKKEIVQCVVLGVSVIAVIAASSSVSAAAYIMNRSGNIIEYGTLNQPTADDTTEPQTVSTKDCTMGISATEDTVSFELASGMMLPGTGFVLSFGDEVEGNGMIKAASANKVEIVINDITFVIGKNESEQSNENKEMVLEHEGLQRVITTYPQQGITIYTDVSIEQVETVKQAMEKMSLATVSTQTVTINGHAFIGALAEVTGNKFLINGEKENFLVIAQDTSDYNDGTASNDYPGLKSIDDKISGYSLYVCDGTPTDLLVGIQKL